MILGSTYNNAARSAVGTGWNSSRPRLALRNACLAMLALVAAMIAGEACSSALEQPASSRDNAELDQLPPPDVAEKPDSAPSRKTSSPTTPVANPKKSTSVLLPPIANLPEYKENPRSSTTQSSGPAKKESAPAFLEPPPSVSRPNQQEMDTNLEVIVGQPRVLTFPDVPHRVALAVNEDDPIATLKEVPHRPREWYLIGKKTGLTYLDVWLPDAHSASSDRVLHFHVRIRSDAPAKAEKKVEKPESDQPRILTAPPARQQPAKVASQKPQPQSTPPVGPQNERTQVDPATQAQLYQTLEEEINRTFPGSSIHLKQVGDKLVVSGNARNVFDATRILSVARAHAPGHDVGEAGRLPSTTASLQATLDNYAHVGGPRVVNLLRIPGEQQIMLRVVVAEVNRAAARSLGLDFGIAEKQATILPRRSAAQDNTSTVSANGWIGQLVRTLQDLHYAQSLAEPTLTTINGQTARFQVGGEFPIPIVSPSAQGAVQGVAFRSYGVHLSMQPVLTDSDRIRLGVDVEVSGTDAQASMQVSNSSVPGLKVRNFQSTVELREGETLAVAGLVRNPFVQTMPQNVRPGGGEAPAPDQELVVLISPLLLHPSTNERSDSANRFNSQDIELYLRSRNTIVPRGDALYLIGPQGYAGNRNP